MAVSNKPNVLIMGHSFVRRFYTFLTSERGLRCEQDLGLGSTCCIRFFDIGGRTISKTCSFDCIAVKSFEPDVVIPELGLNDLTPKDVCPETVGSDLADLVAHLFKVTNAKQIFVCQVLHREQLPRRSYNLDVDKLNKYLKAVISDIPNAIGVCHPSGYTPAITRSSCCGRSSSKRSRAILAISQLSGCRHSVP